MVEPLSPRERAILQAYRRDARAQVASPARPPEKQWWNLPAKIEAGRHIAREEARPRHHNDHEDGMRHANWSRRMATEIGPVFSALAGVEHEIENTLPTWAGGDGLPPSEAAMDLVNNFEGLTAWASDRPVNPTRIRDSPISIRRPLKR